jgi:hypothetical protein
MMKMKKMRLVLTLFVVPSLGARAVAQEQCVTCHTGIEQISSVAAMSSLACTFCHMGEAEGTTQEAAHEGMYANPSDFRVVEQTCGLCHSTEVGNLKKSLHATMAGMISGTRYAWGAQDRDAIYATYEVEDDNPQGEHAVASLTQIPTYDPGSPEGPDNNPGDDYLRNQCLRCHLWSDGHQREGDYRASGCAACHMIYSDRGTYEGSDEAISETQADRPRFHRITTKIPETQCIHCHNRGGRTGVSFIGTVESDAYGTPWTEEGGKQDKLHGKNYNHLSADIHYDSGMTCIDCHTKQDLHGDGNIYTKREQAVEIECHDCHGTLEARSNLTTSWGNSITNLNDTDAEIILTSKIDGTQHTVPQISEASFSPEGNAAMVAIPHIEKVECYSCHARWAPQCYGCHAKQDVSEPSGDWLNGRPGGDPSKQSHKDNREAAAFSWEESRSYVRWETPILGINGDGLVSPFITGCQVFFTQMNGETNMVNNKVFTTSDGTSGIGHNPIQPHTITKKPRPCTECHSNPKTLGLGGGIYSINGNFPGGAPITFELERIVDEEGNQLQQTAHAGARPFNKEEMESIDRVGTCVACHASDDRFWSRVTRRARVEDAPTDDLHREAIESILKKSTKGIF